jgi:hypothetical protein
LVRKDRSEVYDSLAFSLSNQNFSIAIQRRYTLLGRLALKDRVETLYSR